VADEYILVADAGTSSARCLVFDRTGTVVGSATRRWSYIDEPDSSPLSRAFDPEGLWPTLCSLIALSMKDAEISPKAIVAITATSQRQAVVFLDKSGREIYAGPNLDLRAVFEGAAIDEEMGDRVYETTGHLPSFLLAPAKLRWFKANRPEAFDKIACVVTLADWIRLRLTGDVASELTLAAEAGLLDIRRRMWCGDLLRDMGLASNDMPLLEAGTSAGLITAQVSAETGMPEGTPVAVAAADTQCGLLGMGVASEYQVGIVAGWSAALQMVTLEPVLSPESRTWAGCFPGEDKWVLESSPGDVGNSYRWLGDTLFGGVPDPFLEMDALAEAVPVGSDGAVTFLGPSRMDMARLGMRLGGFLFPVPLTFSDLGRGQLVRGSLEAIAYAVKSNLLQIEELTGTPARNIAVGGGMTLTTTWTRVLADVLGRETLVSSTPEVSGLGASLCARTAVGEFTSLEEAAASVRPLLQRQEPDAAPSAEYQDLFARWVELSDGLQGMGV
jgi:autoinducer 2 (AI-2) kinase